MPTAECSGASAPAHTISRAACAGAHAATCKPCATLRTRVRTGRRSRRGSRRWAPEGGPVRRSPTPARRRMVAALLLDLKARGLLDQPLVIWSGESGRTPVAAGRYPDKPDGRDHNRSGFTTWLAGGGIKGGRVIGATDEFGFRALDDRIHINDLHATILALLGLDHRELTYLFQGRDQRLTDAGGDREFAARLINRAVLVAHASRSVLRGVGGSAGSLPGGRGLG